MFCNISYRVYGHNYFVGKVVFIFCHIYYYICYVDCLYIPIRFVHMMHSNSCVWSQRSSACNWHHLGESSYFKRDYNTTITQWFCKRYNEKNILHLHLSVFYFYWYLAGYNLQGPAGIREFFILLCDFSDVIRFRKRETSTETDGVRHKLRTRYDIIIRVGFSDEY